MPKRKIRFLHQTPGRENQGAALIPLIIAIVIISTIGAVLLSLSSVGTFNSLLGNSAERAYYLAESGFRYAALTYQQGGESELDAINDQTFTAAPNQEFTLHLRTHKLEVTGGGGSNTLNTQVPFGWVPQIPTGGISGYLKLGTANEREFNYVDIPNPEGTQVNFDKATGNWNASAGEQVRFAARSDGSAVTEGGSLQLQPGTAEDFFPEHNGQFTADGRTYQYRIRDSANDRLLGITSVDGPWIAPSLNNNEAIVLNDFVTVYSTGNYGQGFFGGTRLVTYHVPYSEASGGGSFHDTFDTKDNWVEGNNGDSAEGSHEIQDYNGDNALAVTETDRIGGTQPDSCLIELDRTSAGVGLDEEWSSSGNYLSYDAQVKIQTSGEPVFMDGISFRLDENLNGYGISLLKAASGGADGIPYSIAPEEGQAMVVLWQRNDPDYNNWTWLAYQMLETDEIFVSDVFFEDDMESGDARWNSSGDWARISSDSHSGTYCWRDIPLGPNPRNSTRTLESISLDLSDASNPILSFWHHYSIWTRSGNVGGRIEISTNQGGNWQQLSQDYQGILLDWTRQLIDLSDYAGEPDVRIRFNLRVRGNPFVHNEDWYVDDVKIYEGDWPSLLVSLKEAESVSFVGGNTQINAGDTIYQEDAGGNVTASATVYTDPVLSSGSWGGNDAAGDLLLRNVSGSFQSGEDLLVSGIQCAVSDAVNGKQNYIRAYIGDTEAHGTPGTDPLDQQRLANPRGDANWPPRDADHTASTNDYYTLIQWNSNVDGTVTRLGTKNELNAVIRTNSLVTPSGGSFPATRPELGLHTWGWGSSNGQPDSGEVPDIYFDDFAVRLEGGTASGGFAPAIQESAAGQ